MNMLTMEQINKGLSMNGGVAGRLSNRRQMMMQEELKQLREEVKEEVKDMKRDSFMEVVRFVNSMEVADVVVDSIPTVEAEIIGIIGHGIECALYEEEEDRVELPSWCASHATQGVRYTEPLLAPLV